MASKRTLLDLHKRSPQAPTSTETPDAALSQAHIEESLDGEPAGAAGVALSVVYLKNGHLDPAHDLAQAVGGQDGDAAHALMHRMEGDYSNTRYWHKRTGRHPTHEELGAIDAALEADIPGLVAEGVYEPSALTAAIESGNPSLQAAAATLHNMELDALFDWCIGQLDD